MSVFKRDRRRKLKLKKMFFTLFFLLIIIFLAWFYFLLWPFRSFFWDIPSIMGFYWERNYLIVLQNNYEKRPSGWFIASYGVVKTFMWKTSFDIKDSYDIPDPSPKMEPPYPLNELLSSDKRYKWWVFRDSNWSPDFSISAKNIISFYDRSLGIKSSFDWVISIDMDVLKWLLELVWPLKIWINVFDSSNYYYLIQVLTKNIDLHSEKALNERKQFLKPLISQIWKKLIRDFLNIDRFVKLNKKLLDTKHIQLFFTDLDLQSKMSNYWWTWEFNPTAEDYVHVNIANIWWRKSDRYIQQTNFYDVSFDEDNNAIWELKIVLKHRWTKSLISDFYQAYIRIYLPKNIKLITTDLNFADKERTMADLDSLVVWWLIHMFPWDEIELSLKYELPKIIKSKDYNLEIITQSGQPKENWHITVQNLTDHFWHWNVESNENLAYFDWSIHSNKLINLKDAGDDTPPIVVWQRFVNNNTIEINFSEKLKEDFIKNLNNISIVDKNKKNNDFNQISIKELEFIDNSLFITLKWITYQKWEHYLLSLKWVLDRSWNYTMPTPLELTVVQN